MCLQELHYYYYYHNQCNSPVPSFIDYLYFIIINATACWYRMISPDCSRIFLILTTTWEEGGRKREKERKDNNLDNINLGTNTCIYKVQYITTHKPINIYNPLIILNQQWKKPQSIPLTNSLNMYNNMIIIIYILLWRGSHTFVVNSEIILGEAYVGILVFGAPLAREVCLSLLYLWIKEWESLGLICGHFHLAPFFNRRHFEYFNYPPRSSSLKNYFLNSKF